MDQQLAARARRVVSIPVAAGGVGLPNRLGVCLAGSSSPWITSFFPLRNNSWLLSGEERLLASRYSWLVARKEWLLVIVMPFQDYGKVGKAVFVDGRRVVIVEGGVSQSAR